MGKVVEYSDSFECSNSHQYAEKEKNGGEVDVF